MVEKRGVTLTWGQLAVLIASMVGFSLLVSLLLVSWLTPPLSRLTADDAVWAGDYKIIKFKCPPLVNVYGARLVLKKADGEEENGPTLTFSEAVEDSAIRVAFKVVDGDVSGKMSLSGSTALFEFKNAFVNNHYGWYRPQNYHGPYVELMSNYDNQSGERNRIGVTFLMNPP